MAFNLIKTKSEKQELKEFRSDFRNLLDDFFNLEPSGLVQNAWNPAVDLKEDEKGIHLSVEVPGMDEKDINISVENNSLVISGEKKELHEEKGKNGYYYSECSYGSFSRTIALPEGIKSDKAKALYKNGVVKIDFPKPEVKEAKKIKIDVK